MRDCRTRAGSPMLSTISSRSLSGMTSRILFSTDWNMPFGCFDARTGRCANMKLDLTRIDDGKEVASYEHQHCGSERDYQNCNGGTIMRRVSKVVRIPT